MSFPRRTLSLGLIALSSSLGLIYILRKEMNKPDDLQQSLSSKSPYPVWDLHKRPSPLARDMETGLMLPPRMASKAEEDDNLIENVVLYLG
ncbi:hypothetical protein I302_106600 [Kwoniella bestiolae CBS 10118]|uniref:Uncharacterized protein n=1 Tax=Kwoniella bestiolae CBS 10118 TaxID=1296100 RepID=A0AAJ8MAQ6_9TREE